MDATDTTTITSTNATTITVYAGSDYEQQEIRNVISETFVFYLQMRVLKFSNLTSIFSFRSLTHSLTLSLSLSHSFSIFLQDEFDYYHLNNKRKTNEMSCPFVAKWFCMYIYTYNYKQIVMVYTDSLTRIKRELLTISFFYYLIFTIVYSMIRSLN